MTQLPAPSLPSPAPRPPQPMSQPPQQPLQQVAPTPPKKRRRTWRWLGIVVGALLALVVGITIASEPESEETTKATTAPSEIADPDALVADEVGSVGVGDLSSADAWAAYVAEAQPLTDEVSTLLSEVGGFAAAAGKDPEGWVAGAYSVEAVDYWLRATTIHEQWNSSSRYVPEEAEKVDRELGVALDHVLGATDHFSNSALSSGDVDYATSEINLAAADMQQANFWINGASESLLAAAP